MLKWKLIILMVSVVVVGCARYGQPVISSPINGQKIVLQDAGCFTVQLQDQEYRDTTIEIVGEEAFGNDINCPGGVNSPVHCCLTYKDPWQNQNTYYNQQWENCVEGRPCQLTIIARRGDEMDIVAISVVKYSYGTATGSSPYSQYNYQLQNQQPYQYPQLPNN